MATDLHAGEVIASARVVRTFTTVTKDGRTVQYKRGDELTSEQVAAFRNVKAMIDVPYLIPRYGHKGSRFIIKDKDGFTVIEGRKINDQPLTREAAQELLEAS